MPREVVGYACEFECGSPPRIRRMDMERHESECLNNPATRTCKTCVFEGDRNGLLVCEYEEDFLRESYRNQVQVDCDGWDEYLG